MSNPIALVVIHGMGSQDEHFADDMISGLTVRFADEIRNEEPHAPESQVLIEPAHWAPVFQAAQEHLWNRLRDSGEMDFRSLRSFIVHAMGDAAAYQQNDGDSTRYGAVHAIVAEALKRLAGRHPTARAAPLVVAAHSLGAMIAGNYIWDLQKHRASRPLIPPEVSAQMTGGRLQSATDLELGKTFVQLHTYGTTLPIWNLRYENFGTPVSFPEQHPAAGWWNYWDEDDILGYPFSRVSEAYNIVHDVRVNVGGVLSSWNPKSHTEYESDKDLQNPMAKQLARLWRHHNGRPV